MQEIKREWIEQLVQYSVIQLEELDKEINLHSEKKIGPSYDLGILIGKKIVTYTMFEYFKTMLKQSDEEVTEANVIDNDDENISQNISII